MTDILAKVLRPSGQAIESRVGDETVLLHPENGAYYGLDAVGTRVWELLKDGLEPLAIVAKLAREYDAKPEAVEADVRQFLEDLAANRIVTGD